MVLIPETGVSWLLLFSILAVEFVEFVPSDTVNVTGSIISDFLSSSSKYEKVPSIVLFPIDPLSAVNLYFNVIVSSAGIEYQTNKAFDLSKEKEAPAFDISSINIPGAFSSQVIIELDRLQILY